MYKGEKMSEIYSRTQRLIGGQALNRLKSSKVIVFGIGGVGSYVVEALARAGVGTLCLVDGDAVCESNINRQLIALHSTLGKDKVAVAASRVSDINPDINVIEKKLFYLPETADEIDLSDYDYVVDAVDTVTAKLEIISRAKAAGVNVISSMGTGNKLSLDFEICDISKTSVGPLARVMRAELKKRGVKGVKVLYSKAKPIIPPDGDRTPASISYVPSVAGLTIAGEVISDLIKSL